MLKPFTYIEDILDNPHHKFSERKLAVLQKAIDAISEDKISGAKSRKNNKMTVWTFCSVSDLPQVEGIRWKQDCYFDENELTCSED